MREGHPVRKALRQLCQGSIGIVQIQARTVTPEPNWSYLRSFAQWEVERLLEPEPAFIVDDDDPGGL